jgi:DUF1009 family protein
MVKRALLAGTGALPQLLIDTGEFSLVIGFHSNLDPNFKPTIPFEIYKMGSVGSILKCLKRHNITEIVLAGAVQKPSIMELGLDAKGMKWIIQAGVKVWGDDSLLRRVLNLLNNEGLHIRPASDFLPQIICPLGNLSMYGPTDDDMHDINLGKSILFALSSFDVGQSIVIQQGMVLGMEGIDGTDALIERCGPLKRQGTGPILIKMSKSNQSQLVDLPTIGPKTIESCIKHGFNGIAIEAKKTQILPGTNYDSLFCIGIEY